jgi:hypothetical protein
MTLVSMTLAYLEVWGLLSRGYTLGVLLTLYKAQAPLTESQIAAAYRGGDGLTWIMSHRLGGLTAARLVAVRDGAVQLTPLLGRIVAHSYRAAITVLGLRRTG